jgi:hypothetical protein
MVWETRPPLSILISNYSSIICRSVGSGCLFQPTKENNKNAFGGWGRIELPWLFLDTRLFADCFFLKDNHLTFCLLTVTI